MKIEQSNPEQQIMEVRQVGIGTASSNGMVSRLALLLKGKIHTGQIKNWELQFESFNEVEELIEQLHDLRRFASENNDLCKTLKKKA
jgi:hypothetical protein